MTDAVEVLSLHSDPLVVDLDGTYQTVATICGSSFATAMGSWMFSQKEGPTLLDRAGRLDYPQGISIPRDSFYRLFVRGKRFHPSVAEMKCCIDGGSISLSNFEIEADGSFSAWFDPPALTSGTHDFSIQVHTVRNGTRTTISEISVLYPEGPDADGDGVRDWEESRKSFSSLDSSGIVLSKVSPFCLRGSAPEYTSVSTVPALAVKPLPSHGWWASVPLKQDDATDISVRFEPGVPNESISVVWDSFNLLTENGLSLGVDDALLMRGADDDAVSVSIPGVTNLVIEPGVSVPVQFSTPGHFIATVQSAGVSRLIAFDVADVHLGSSVPAWKGKSNRLWLSGQYVNDAVVVSEDDLIPSSITSVSGGVEAAVSVPHFRGNHVISVELPDGRVLDSAPISGFEAFYSIDDNYHCVEQLADGTNVAEVRLRVLGLSPDMSFAMHTYQAGVCFENGSSRMVFPSTSFDQNGELVYRFFAPASVSNPCQFLSAWVLNHKIAE